MKPFLPHISRNAHLLIFLWPFAVVYGQQPDVKEIIKRSADLVQQSLQELPKYTYLETDRDGGNSKTYQVSMIYGSPYERLVEVDGEPLSKADEAKEQQKLNQVTAQRKSESKEQRAKRIADYQKERHRDNQMMQQLTEAFDFKLVGDRQLDGYDVYFLRATPRKGYQPPNMASQVLTGMRGQLWIDKKSGQWVKVTAQVIHPVTIEGFLAEVEPGTHFELDRMQVEDGSWLPKHFIMRSRSKILMMFNHSTAADQTFSDYHLQQKQQ